jgi:hypothetical protein
MISAAILPVDTPLAVIMDFGASQQDEINLARGEYVSVISHSYDGIFQEYLHLGWAFGVNLNTNAEGFFPLTVVSPSFGNPAFKITLINCSQTTNDIVGLDLIDAALITYPNQVLIHHIVSDMSSVRDGVSGFIREGKLDDKIIKEIIGVVGGGRKAICSGPVGFNSMAVDCLFELGWTGDEVVSLGERI